MSSGSWEEALFSVFDDLEQQADALFHVERAIELIDRGESEYGQVTMASRLMASAGVGAQVAMGVMGFGLLRGQLDRIADGWCLISAGEQEWIVRLAAITSVAGASPRSVPEIAWSPVTKLGLGSALRRIASERGECVLHLTDGTTHECRPMRVGADFVEAVVGARDRALFAFEALAVVQKRDR